MKARKLPSGKWNIEVYVGKDSQGKRIRESFTAATKAEVELMASKFKNNVDRQRSSDLTVSEAGEAYIKANENVLSPSTLRGYKMDAKRLQPIGHLRIRKITSYDIQSFVSELSSTHSPKTVKNTYAFLVTSLGFCGVEQKFKVNLPKIPKQTKYAPENEQIKVLYDNANPVMKRAIMLAAFHSLRRGEICGLTYGDLKGNTLLVHSDMVLGPDGWVHKETPKTESSYRQVFLTDKEVEILGQGKPDEYIVPIKPSTLDGNFKRLCNKLGIEGLIFHNLRSYFASIAVAIGIPDIYLSHMGGWRENSTVLKEHYQKKIVSIDEAYTNKMNTYFDKMMENSPNESPNENLETS
jgi:integrase